MLPDDNIRKMKQYLGDMDAQLESKTRREPVLEDRPAFDSDQSPADDD